MSNPKKEVLQKILTALVPYWDLAEGFLLLVNGEGNDELIENLYTEIITEIKDIKSKNQQQKIKSALQKLRKESEETIKSDEEDAEKMLDNFINNI